MPYILVAAYDAIIRTMFSELLTLEGHSVTEARNFAELLVALRTSPHPLVVVYVRDGYLNYLPDDKEHALVRMTDALRRHAYVEVRFDVHPFVGPLQALYDELAPEVLHGPCTADALLDRVNRAAARPTTR